MGPQAPTQNTDEKELFALCLCVGTLGQWPRGLAGPPGLLPRGAACLGKGPLSLELIAAQGLPHLSGSGLGGVPREGSEKGDTSSTFLPPLRTLRAESFPTVLHSAREVKKASRV